MSLRGAPRGVYRDPQLGFVGVGATSRAPAADMWQHRLHQEQDGYASYSLEQNSGAAENQAWQMGAGGKPRMPHQPVRQQHKPAPAAGYAPQPGHQSAAAGPSPPLPAGSRANILREVDNFVMSLPLGTTPVCAEIEEAVASRLYRSELGAAEARSKLGEWSKLALELKEVVEQQQAQLERQHGHGGDIKAAAGAQGYPTARPAPSAANPAKPHLTQLQRLVHDMRAELRQPAPPAGAAQEAAAVAGAPALPSQHGRYATRWEDGSGSAAAEHVHRGEPQLQEQLAQQQQQVREVQQELASAQAEVQALQAERTALVAAQQAAAHEGSSEAAAAQLQLQHAQQEAQTAKEEKERLRRALIDAEIELQRKANDAAALQSQLAAAGQHKEAAEAASAQLSAAQADAAALRQQLAAAQAATEQQGAAHEAQLQAAKSAADQLRAELAAAEAAAASQRQQKEAANALIAQLQSQVVSLQAAAASNSSAAAADAALLQEQLTAAAQREAAAQAEIRTVVAQLDSVKRAHGEALNAARSSQQQLAATQEELAVARAGLEQAQQQREGSPSAEAVAERDREISALKAVLDRITAAAQQKDAQICAAQREAAAAVAERDAALAEQAATESLATSWREAAAEAEAQEAELAAARQQAAAAEARLMQAQMSAAADAQRWEQQLLALQAQLQEQQCGGAGAAAQQALLQAEVAELRQLLSAKDQQIGALSASTRPGSADGGQGRAGLEAQQHLQAQVDQLLSELAALKRALTASDAAAAAASAAAAQAEQRAQQLAGAEERDQQQLAAAVQQHQQQLAATEEQHRQQLAAAEERHQKQLEAAEEQHEQQLAAAEERHQQHLEAAKEQHEQQLAAVQEQHQQELAATEERLAQQLAAVEEQLAAAEQQHRQQLAEVQHACSTAEHRAADSAAAAAEWRQQAALLRQQLESATQLQQQPPTMQQQQQQPLKSPAVARHTHVALDSPSGSQGSGLIPAVAAPEKPDPLCQQQQHMQHEQVSAFSDDAQSCSPLPTQRQTQPVVLQITVVDAPPAELAPARKQQEERSATAGVAACLQEQEARLWAEFEEQQRRQQEAQLAVLQALEEQQEVQLEGLRRECKLAQQAAAALQLGQAAAGAQHAQQLAQVQQQHCAALEEARAEYAAALEALEQQHASQLEQLQRQHAAEVEHLAETDLQEPQQQAAAARSGDATPSPIQRRFQQRLRQVVEQHEEEMLLLLQQHEQELESERRCSADAVQQARHAAQQQLEALAAEHEEQLKEVRRCHEAAFEARELQHLVELEAAVESSSVALGLAEGGGDSLAARLRALEARRVEQEGELVTLRAALADQKAEHELQLAAVMAKQSLLLVEELEREAQQAQQRDAQQAQPLEKQSPPQQQLEPSALVGELSQGQLMPLLVPSPPQQQQQQQQQGVVQQLREEHSAEVARVLTGAIFASVLSRQPRPSAAAAAVQVGSPGPDLQLPPGEHMRVQDICTSSGHASLTSSVRRQHSAGSGLRSCRITAAALASGGSSGAASPAAGARSARRQLLADAPGAVPMTGQSPHSSRFSSRLRSELSQAAELAVEAGCASSRSSMDGAAAAAEVARLAEALEEAVAECDRRGSALQDCQEMLEELQTFAEGQKNELATVRAELEESHRCGREGQHRLRGLEEQLLAAQDACGKANSQVTKLERKCTAYREELRSLQSMHDALQSEHTAACGQLTAAQQQHGVTLDRLQRLAERLALVQQEKVRVEEELGTLKQRMQLLRDEHSQEAEHLLHELLLQRLRASSAGDSNSGGRARSGGSGAPVGNSGTGPLSGSAEEASLAPHLQQQQRPHPHQQQYHHHPQQQQGQQQDQGQLGRAMAVHSGDSAAAGKPAPHQEGALQHGSRQPGGFSSAPAVNGLPPASQQLEVPAGPGRLPAIPSRLPPHLRLEAASGSAGGSAAQTPRSARSVESAWSDSVAELTPAAQKKKRGALHKLGKMLRGNNSKGSRHSAGSEVGPTGPTPLGLPPRQRPNPAALTAPLEHSMREKEAAALQEQLLRERQPAQQQQGAADAQAGEQAQWQQQQQQVGAGPEPLELPRAIRQHMQQQQQAPGQQQSAAQPRLPGRKQPFPAAANDAAAAAAGWPDYTTAWLQQQAELQAEAEAAALRHAAAGGRAEQHKRGRHEQQGAPLGQQAEQPEWRVNPYAAAAAQQRPSSGPSEVPPEGGLYCYPEAAAAGYAAGLAAVQAEGELAELGLEDMLATPPPVLKAGGVFAGLAADKEAGGAQPVVEESAYVEPSWQQRDLHVVHNNDLYDNTRAL